MIRNIIIAILPLILISPVLAGDLTPMQADIVAYSEEPVKIDFLSNPEGGEIVRTGSFYDFETKKWQATAMKRILGIGKDYYQFWILTGYGTTEKALVSVSYDVTPLFAGAVGVPLFDMISLDFGYYAGYDFKYNKISQGMGTTFLKINVAKTMESLGISIY